jgi:hypothetical protein
MTPDACREWRGALASAALDRLDGAEEVALQAHLDGCGECRAELADLRGVATVLPAVELSELESEPVEPAHGLADRVSEGVARERASRRRLRVRTALIAAAATIAIVVGGVAVLLARAPDDPERRRVEFSAMAGGRATATLTAVPEGTEVTFRATGLENGEWYWLWTTGDDDDRVSAGTFQGSDRSAELHLVSALPLEETMRVWVTDGDDDVVFDAWLDGAPEQETVE